MAKDQFTEKWIIENSLEIIRQFESGVLTIRGLHYQLVSVGMSNTIRHYKRVVNAMIKCRRDGRVSYNTFSDRDRAMENQTRFEQTIYEDEVERAKTSIKGWMSYYFKNRWENQHYYPEVLIEKKALIGTFDPVCKKWDVAIGACKGYPSLTFLYEASLRFEEAVSQGKAPIILYFGDYDPSGEDIPRSIQDNLSKDFGIEVELKRIALLESQVKEWNLPPAPAKETDSRTQQWDGLGQVELDAVHPKKLQKLVEEAIEEIFDYEKYQELKEQEAEEKERYVAEIKEHVIGLSDNQEE